MANKRIKDADSAADGGTTSDKIAVDRSDYSEFKSLTIQELVTIIKAGYIYTTTFTSANQGSSPNYDVQITHNLSTNYPTVTITDNSGNQRTVEGKVYVSTSNIIILRMHHAVVGTWIVKVSAL